jgi:hypothetical protein
MICVGVEASAESERRKWLGKKGMRLGEISKEGVDESKGQVYLSSPQV